MRKSGAVASSAKGNVNVPHDSIKAKYFYMGVFALRRLNAGKSRTPGKRTVVSGSTDARRR